MSEHIAPKHPSRKKLDPESHRLREEAARRVNWKRWGPYLAERQWGTVREDYSVDGACWDHFSHDQARSRAYRWGEDGLLGFCDRECRLCFSMALWNGLDPILKERPFGLTGPQGNHGEDVKEAYYYLDATPTHSYMRALYKYPQSAYPYQQLIEENARRSRMQSEYELWHTGVFAESRYFDVQVEYAKASADDILIRLCAFNRGPDAAVLHLLPTVWFRNTWSWGCTHEGCQVRPSLEAVSDQRILASHPTLGEFVVDVGKGPDGRVPTLLFTHNQTNTQRLYGTLPVEPYAKDAFHEYVIQGNSQAVNPQRKGTKAAAHYQQVIPAGGQVRVCWRLTLSGHARKQPFGKGFDKIFQRRRDEADQFYALEFPPHANAVQRRVIRQSYAGLLWSKQFYHYSVRDWLSGDANMPLPPAERYEGRNHAWTHLFNRDVISMPDKWEYPWYAAWDLAFHMIPFARVDPQFAKDQLVLLLREWYMHPNGQIPAYEFAFGDVNPPVHAWACWRVYKMTGPRGKRDRRFLAGVFHKLLINFTWWVNRKDQDGRNLFTGGFLGLDNIGLFDRSQMNLGDGRLEQADATAWMAFYCTTMLSMALELAREDPSYEGVASKFFEHFVVIADAINNLDGSGMWDETDGFYYDQIVDDQKTRRLKVRSMVGLLPLIAVQVLDESLLQSLPGFYKRMMWLLRNRSDLAQQVSYLCRTEKSASGCRLLLSIVPEERLRRVLAYMLSETEFLSPFGLRSLSHYHADHPVEMNLHGRPFRVDYEPGESRSSMFGGNSNWRGPVWFPLNYLLIEALERYHYFYDSSLTVEYPTGSGRSMTLTQVADELRCRLAALFLPGVEGQRPCHGEDRRYADDPHFRDLVLFYEYFHGDTGRGLGASHQTGWTALVSECLTRRHADASKSGGQFAAP